MPQLPPLPPIATQPLSVVLLAHESPHLAGVVDGWVKFLDGLGRDYEVILVDDASSDRTPERIDNLVKRHPGLRVLRHETHKGEGAALRTGVAAAQHPLLFYTVCEPSFRPADLGRLLEKRADPAGADLEIDHVHLISGFRAGVPMPALLRGVGFLWRLFCRVVLTYAPPRSPGWLGWRRTAGRFLARLVFGIRYRDVACPFRLIRRDAFARIPIQSDGPFAHVEVLAKANFLRHLMGEEIALNVKPPPYCGDARAIICEGYRVFNEPDFGPASLSEPEA
jgi:glycosyltransferase involved in cell wall biosynthesis